MLEIGEKPLLFIGVVLIALFVRPFARKTCIPYPIVLLIIGIVASLILIKMGYKTGVREAGAQKRILYLFLPTLIFQSAYTIKLSKIYEHLGSLLYFGIIVMLLTFSVSSIVLYYTGGEAFPWLAAMIAASILAGTAASAISDLLSRHEISNSALSNILRGESLFSVIFAIAIFNVLILIATLPSGKDFTTSDWIVQLFQEIGGGLFVGVMVGGLSLGVLMINTNPGLQAFITIASVYFAYIFAQDILGVSGAWSSAALGLLYSNLAKPLEREVARDFVGHFWSMANLLVYTCVFLLVGVSASQKAFIIPWTALIITTLTVFAIRFLCIYYLQPIWQRGVFRSHIAAIHKPLLFLGGARGATAAVLAFYVPETLPYAAQIQTTVFSIVILSILLQIPSACFWLFKYRNTLPDNGE